MNPPEKIAKLRQLMKKHQIDAWLVPSADPHQSEYVAPHWQTRAWLSRFNGSAGLLIITQKTAGLWTDSRYHIRAKNELEGSGIELFKQGLPGVPSPFEWLQETLPDGATLGFDGSVVSKRYFKQLKQALSKKSVQFAYQDDLTAQIWDDRPEIPQNPVFLHDIEHAGETRQAKFQRVRQELKKLGVQAQLITTLDEIAWLFNLRGSDIPNNPVAIAYAVISQKEARLFIQPQKLPADVKSTLAADGVQFSEYAAIYDYWENQPQNRAVLVDAKQTNHKLFQSVAQNCQIVKGISIPFTLKAVKNQAEIEGMRQAHIMDGVAVVKWLYWLEHNLAAINTYTEITLAEKLTEFRNLASTYVGTSFNSIIGYQANSAVGHYNAQPETTPHIQPAGILLADTGAQYLNGTTDITRTISLSAPTTEERHVFTVVLKSLITLSRAEFPAGATGGQLDTLAREVLWRYGYMCRHGIGHGIGAFLNVHENPPRLSRGNNVAVEPGMLTTIEPGVYFEGKFGVRLENVVLTVSQETTEFGEFLGFETMTLCPLNLDLIELDLLTEDERIWLNDYHAKVYEILSRLLSADEEIWLKKQTRPII